MSMEQRINEIINSRCIVDIKTGIVSYGNFSWKNKKLKNSYEVPWKGFKRNHLVAYKEEVNKIFDELHPY